MAKKEQVVEVKAIAKDVPVCQNCRSHSNNPSYCSNKEEYTGRKASCEDFRK